MRDFLNSMRTFLSSAPFAQLDRALDYELLWAARLSPRLFCVFIRLGPPLSGQEVPVCDRKWQVNANPAQTESSPLPGLIRWEFPFSPHHGREGEIPFRRVVFSESACIHHRMAFVRAFDGSDCESAATPSIRRKGACTKVE
jgi:hypothetical protein